MFASRIIDVTGGGGGGVGVKGPGLDGGFLAVGSLRRGSVWTCAGVKVSWVRTCVCVKVDWIWNGVGVKVGWVRKCGDDPP